MQGTLKAPIKANFLCIFLIFLSNTKAFCQKMWFLSFSTKNDAESSRNFVNNSVFNLKCAKLNQQSEIWTHMGPYGPGPGPWRAGKVQEKHKFLNSLFTKKIVFGIQTPFFDGFNVLLSFLAEKWYRTNMKSPSKPRVGTKTSSYVKKKPPPHLLISTANKCNRLSFRKHRYWPISSHLIPGQGIRARAMESTA